MTTRTAEVDSGAKQVGHVALTHDGTLVLAVAEELVAHVAPWVPRSLTLRVDPGAADAAARTHDVARIDVRAARPDDVVAPVSDAPELTFLGILAWPDESGATRVGTANGGVSGWIDLARRRATLIVAHTDATSLLALHGGLTLAAALLLGRTRRALMHAASLLAPDGHAWLLVGDTHAGKSSTCATLLDAGWSYCSDDHTLVGAWRAVDRPGVLQVEGWPRVLHLDPGWDIGIPTLGTRADVDALARWPGRWRRTAPLGGALFLRVDADLPTALAPLSVADRFSRLVRQSPWLFADRAAASGMADLFGQIAALPGAALRLGRDAFRQPARLRDVLEPLIGGAPGHQN